MKVFQLQSLLLAGCVLVVAFPGFLSIPKVSSTISPRSEDAMIPNPPLYGPYYDWRAPCPDDERGPCPGLNTLANHGLLPRSGRGITLQDTISGFKAGMNVAAAAITIVTTIALKQCSDIKRIDCKSFDLSQLRLPHAFEHDNSMSREDSNNLTLNNWKFSQEIFNQVLNVWQNYTEITPALAHRARDVRVNDAHSRDIPGWFQENMQSSYIENAQYLLVFWDEQKKSARKDWIKYFFENERLPHYLGWRADQRMEISADASRAMAAQIAKAS